MPTVYHREMIVVSRERRPPMHPQTLLGIVMLVLAMACIAAAEATPRALEVSADDYSVYNTVLNNMKLDDFHVVIAKKTLDFGCGKYSDGVPLANNCSFMTMAPDTPVQIRELLQSSWPRLSASTWNDFEKENAESVELQDLFTTSWKHVFDGVGAEGKESKEPDSPDFVLWLSRVGFDAKKTEAIVFVLLFSYVDNVSSAGDYFRFRLNGQGRWEINGRVRYFEQDPDQSKVAK